MHTSPKALKSSNRQAHKPSSQHTPKPSMFELDPRRNTRSPQIINHSNPQALKLQNPRTLHWLHQSEIPNALPATAMLWGSIWWLPGSVGRNIGQRGRAKDGRRRHTAHTTDTYERLVKWQRFEFSKVIESTQPPRCFERLRHCDEIDFES